MKRFLALPVAFLALALSGCTATTRSTTPTPDSRPPTASVVPVSPSEASTQQSRLVLGSPEPGLSFPAPSKADLDSERNRVAGPSTTRQGRAAPIVATSPSAAAAAFGDAVVSGRVEDAFTLLPDIEQERIGSATRFADILRRDPAWLSAAVDSKASDDRDVPALRVGQSATIDEIRGVVGPTAVVKLPARKDPSGWKVSWERRTVIQGYAAPENRVPGDVVSWATERQRNCSPEGRSGSKTVDGEYAGGLLGAVWLANALCATPGAVTVASVGDIYTLDDPQALLDAYGSGAYQWARVVTLAAPHAMHVIAAPLDDRWVVVGLAAVPSAP